MPEWVKLAEGLKLAERLGVELLAVVQQMAKYIVSIVMIIGPSDKTNFWCS